ncbi:MAG: UDP-N-acetylmuramate dehydrogenase [Candidatus Peribacteraceae bacterium]|nr:UDP-N-acetylmuramate dehydrogenase [Candidatus Peribacteraceae bacterium]
MIFREHFPIGSKTTMRIGGTVRYYAELKTREDCEEAIAFAADKKIPIIPLGSGSNTIFTDGEVNALVVQLRNYSVAIDGNSVTVGCGKNLPMLINELAAKGLDLSPLTGIPGTVGGALFGNAGQGPKGIWIDSFVNSVTAFMDGAWHMMDRENCTFGYRESKFKHSKTPVILFETTFIIPSGDPAIIKQSIESLLQKRIDTQPHVRTAGSCFKAVGDVPAWKLIDAAGLRGTKIGDIEIAQKHANFLLNTGKATYSDAKKVVELVKQKITQPLDVEMRFVEENGTLAF